MRFSSHEKTVSKPQLIWNFSKIYPSDIRYFTTSRCPLLQARWSGVVWDLSAASIGASFLTRSFTISSAPTSAAQCSGVHPFVFELSTGAPPFMSNRASLTLELLAAIWSGEPSFLLSLYIAFLVLNKKSVKKIYFLKDIYFWQQLLYFAQRDTLPPPSGSS